MSRAIAEITPIPVALATSNEGKLGRATEAAIKIGLESLQTTTPLFDEEQIKVQMEHLRDNGISYTVGISQSKLHTQRQETLKAEGTEQDYIIVVSDSVLLDNANRPLNRDNETDGRKAEILKDINREQRVTFAGAVSFGRKNGHGCITVVSYCSIPLASTLTELPANINMLPTIQDPQNPIEVGYFIFGGDHEMPQTKKPIKETTSFEDARPYISGLTPEVLELVHETGQFEAQIGPIIEDVIATYPFNTASFYHALEQHGGTPEEFYATFPTSWRDHLQQYGGNCALLSLEAGRRIEDQGKNAHVLLYPQNGKPESHSALMLTDINGRQYFADPGFSMPYVIPIDAQIPIAPSRISGSKSMTVRDNTSQPPTVHISERTGKTHLLPSNGQYTLDNFEQKLPEVLGKLHQRDAIKLDFHTREGHRTIGFTALPGRRQLQIRNHDQSLGTYSLDEFHYDISPDIVDRVNVLALQHNADPFHVIAQLDTVRRHSR